MSDQLTHHGIKGMRWGVRRTQRQLGHVTFRKKRPAEDEGDASKLRSSASPVKKSSDVSDDELRRMISRIELEKKYRELTSVPQQQKTNKGREFVMGVLKKSGEQILVGSLTNIGTQALSYYLGTKINSTVANKTKGVHKDIVNPRKGQKDSKK